MAVPGLTDRRDRLRTLLRLRRWHLNGWRSVATLVWPPACVCCGGDVLRPLGSARELVRQLCGGCMNELNRQSAAARCPTCGRERPAETCESCGGTGLDPAVTRVVAAGPTRDPLRRLVHLLKFGSAWELAPALAGRLARAPGMADLADTGNLVVVPVPLHRARRATRGYNQAQLLAASLARRIGSTCVDALIRTRWTPPQTRVGGAVHRQSNVARVFECVRPEAVVGRHVLLVDDVMTTGATVRTAARALRRAEPASVSVAVLCVTEKYDADADV